MSGADYTVAEWETPSMGGTLAIAIATEDATLDVAVRDAARVGRRVNAWAQRLTRFDSTSELSRLNATAGGRQEVGPTLGSVLAWALQACARAPVVIDISLLDARQAAEAGATNQPTVHPADFPWSLHRVGRRTEVRRTVGTRFDLDGIAKGWLADRAGDLLWRWPGGYVDADGDISLAACDDVEWRVEVVDPRPGALEPLARLRFSGGNGWRRVVGIATSGTSVHRWRTADGRVNHHLIDPRTRRPAETDVVQATVVAPTARESEVLAKAVVILGSRAGIEYLQRSAAHAALVLVDGGQILMLPGTEAWLA